MNNDARPTDPTQAPDLRMLSAFVDDELSERDSAVVREHLAHDEEAAAQVAAWRAQRAALRALCGATTSDDTQFVVLRVQTPWWRRVALAACWLVAGAGLVVSVEQFVLPNLGGGETATFARRADVAYAVYTPEKRHPVEVAAAEEEHLITWLSKRLNRQLSVPSLQEYGYTLVGGRLLPGEAGPAAQFMYENQSGARLTLYVSGIPKDETAFRLFRDGNRRTFYWVSDGMGYALSGPIAEGKLRSIAVEVCSALGGRPEAWQ
ncbi:anti-sigma factor [Paraburkholderia jirisanensis]